MAASLEDLPQEICIEVLSHLDPKSLAQCASVCKWIYDIVRTSSRLLCIVEMYLDGLEEVSNLDDHAGLLRYVIEHRGSWRSLKWKSDHIISTAHGCQAYELVGGLFAQTNRQEFQILQLPTSTRNYCEIHNFKVGFDARDFAMDPTQDVIVLLEDDVSPLSVVNTRSVRIHTRTITTNVNHPLAKKTPLVFTILPHALYGNGMSTAVLQITEDMVSLYITHHSYPRVLIWNWKEGSLVYDSNDGVTDSLPANTCDFTMLDRSSFALTNTQESGSIELYKLPCLTKLCVPIHLATLHLPSLKEHWRSVILNTHAGPVEANPLPGMSFKKRQHDRLHIFTLSYANMAPTDTPIILLGMYVHQRVFASYLDNWRPEDMDTGESVEISWDHWGPDNTRLIANRSPRHWLRYTHGQRVISSTRAFRDVDILDFSASATCLPISSSAYMHSTREVKNHDHDQPMKLPSRESAQPESGPLTSVDPSNSFENLERGEESSALMGPSRHPCIASPFKYDVETRLPCRVSTKRLPGPYWAHMLYEDGIIGVHMEDDDKLELHMFVI